MNRNYTRYNEDRHLEQWAAARNTSEEVALAIEAIADSRRPMQAIWDNPTAAEADHVEMCLNEWARQGDIEPGIYYWGEEALTVPAE